VPVFSVVPVVSLFSVPDLSTSLRSGRGDGGGRRAGPFRCARLPAVAGSVPLAFAGLLLKLMRPGDPFSLTLGTKKKQLFS
jgi:hypothetical protein